MLGQGESSYQLLRCRTRGSWIDSDYQIYCTKEDQQCADMSDWAFIGFRSSRNLLAQRVSRSDRETPTSARLFNLELKMKEFIKRNSNIKRLDISKTSLDYIPSELAEGLPLLQRLNLSSNDLTESALASQPRMASLIELDLTNNLLCRLPTNLKDMAPRLSRLYIGYNDIESLAGVEAFTGLVLLDAECNLIKSIDWIALSECCRQLQVLRLQYNQVASVDRKVRHMRELRELNLSHNALQQVPVDVFFLPALECLDVSHNSIPRVETIQVTHNLTSNMVNVVDMSHNQLTRMPEFLLLIAHKIDLGSNMITEVPGNILKQMDFKTQQVLDLKDNPVRMPPYEVCEGGLRPMIKFYQHLKLTMPYYQGMKAVVLGNKGVGKTSLVHNIVEDHPHLALPEEETLFCNITEVTKEVTGGDGQKKPLCISMWDFSGDLIYQTVMHQLVDAEALILLTFNMATYRTAEFYKNFGTWLDYLLSKNSQVKLIPVGTHCDLLNETTIRKIAAEVGGKISSFLSQRKAKLLEKMQEIEQLPEISSYLQTQMKHISNVLANCTVHLPPHGKALPVSSKTGAGVQRLMAEVAAMTEKKLKLFPKVLNVIPSLWNEVADTVSSIGRAQSVPLVTWEKFQAELTERHGLKDVMVDVAQHLHDSGKIIWLYNHKGLCNYVVLRPLWLAAVIKNLLGYGTKHHGFTEIEDLCARRGITKARYSKYVEEFVEQGRADAEFLQCLWSRECPISSAGSANLLVSMLSSALDYAYPVERPSLKTRDAQSLLGRVFIEADALKESSGKRKADLVGLLPGEGADAQKKQSTTAHGTASRKVKDSVVEPSERSESRASSITVSSRATKKSHHHAELKETQLPTLLVPTLRAIQDAQLPAEEQDALQRSPSLCVGYRFPIYVPPGLFGRVSVRLTQRKFGLRYLAMWSSGLSAKHDDSEHRLLIEIVTEESQRIEDGSPAELRLTVVGLGDEGEGVKPIQELWKLLLSILNDCEELFSEYAGLYVERYAKCPFCKRSSFRGEWTAPKDMQASASHRCADCQAVVSTDRIIQPVERKAEDVQRVFSELKRRRQSIKADGKLLSTTPKISLANTAPRDESNHSGSYGRRTRRVLEWNGLGK